MPSDHSYRIPANERHALIYILLRKSTHPLGHNDKQAPFSNKLLPLSRTNIYYGQVVGCGHENTTAPLLPTFLNSRDTRKLVFTATLFTNFYASTTAESVQKNTFFSISFISCPCRVPLFALSVLLSFCLFSAITY